MIRSLVLSAAALAAWAAASSARATDDPGASDVHCLAVASLLASNADPKIQSAGVMASLYFLGKLDGRTPTLDLETRLKDELTHYNPQDLQADAVRCGAELAVRGKAVSDIGARLKAQVSKTP
ncbi:MAG: hypothetical protein ACXU8S_09730 [Phenylobacterium sp.]